MSSSSDKNKIPTPPRLRKSREKVDSSRVKDLGMAAGVVASLATLCAFFPYYQQLIHNSFTALRQIASHINDDGALHEFMLLNLLIILKMLVTLIPVPMVVYLTRLIPGGWTFIITRKYAPKKAAAPCIVARGSDDVALRVSKAAQQHQIEIVELPSLARSVHYSRCVNQRAPVSLCRDREPTDPHKRPDHAPHCFVPVRVNTQKASASQRGF